MNGYLKKEQTSPENNECWWGYGEIETFVYYWWEFKIVQMEWKIVQQFLKKLKVELSYDLAVSSIYPKELKAGSQKYLYTHVHNSIMHNY